MSRSRSNERRKVAKPRTRSTRSTKAENLQKRGRPWMPQRGHRCPAARALPTTWQTNWTGGADDSPPVKTGRQTGRNDAASPTATLDANQIGGEPERTTPTPAGSSSSLGAQRPRTPSRSPRRVVLQPNSRWKAVQRVQLHMRASRDSRRQAP